jgi:DNA-binding NarL/FixJ family response regulator
VKRVPPSPTLDTVRSTEDGGTMAGRDEPIRILLADQQSLFREALRTGLESQSDLRVVAQARNGPDAVAEALRSRPDVAIIDADLPVIAGVAAAAEIRERAPMCRVLILGTVEDHRALVGVLEAGANGYLTKEAPLDELISATRAIAAGETLVPPRMLGPLLTGLLRRKREQDSALARISMLTRRERDVLALLADGADTDTIADTLVISPQTARTHIQNILNKLSVHSRLEAAALVAQSGISVDLIPAR